MLAAARATYRRMLAQVGESVTVRRYIGLGAARVPTDAVVVARVIDYMPEQLVGAVQHGDRNLIVLAEDLIASGWPVPPAKNDKIVVRGRELNVEAVDDNTRRIGGVLIAYEIRVRG